MTPLSLLFTLAAIGISETAYLIRKRKKSEAPVCPIGEDCTTVLNSKYNRIFLVHNELAGFLFYIVVSALAAFLVIGVGQAELWDRILRILIWSGVFVSFFLLYLQWRVIKAWCFWCVMSAMTIFGMFVIILTSNLIIF